MPKWDGNTERRSPEWVDGAVKKTLTNLGFDLSNTVEIQKDVASIREVRKHFKDENVILDMAHSRKSRQYCELIQNKVVTVLLATVLLSTVGAAWAGFVGYIDTDKETKVIYRSVK